MPIITISREYGSGGRDIGRLLAEELNLPIYDKEIMHLAAQKSGLSESFVENRSEKVPSKFLQNLKRLSLNVPSVRLPSGYNSLAAAKTITNPKKDQADLLFEAQSQVIRELAAAPTGCVIVGRCASYILRSHPNLLSVFVRAAPADRINRAIQTYNYPEKTAAKTIQKVDKHRANYYNLYTGQTWGASTNYDLTLNTSYCGIPGAVTVIKSMLTAHEAAH